MRITEDLILRLKEDPASFHVEELRELGEALSVLSDKLRPGRVFTRMVLGVELADPMEVETSLYERICNILSALHTESQWVTELTRKQREARQAAEERLDKDRAHRKLLLEELDK